MTNSLCTKREKCTKEQKEAVKHFEGPLLIVAGPGAGKTRVLVERAVYLIKRKNINPENILVITFTIKAAEQLKNRLINCIGSAAENMQVSTIHSFCNEILKDYSDYHDLGATFDVLDEETQLMFLRTHFYPLGLQKFVRMGDLPDIITFFNKCGENKINPDDLISEIEKTYPEKEKYIGLAHIYKKYLDLLEEEHKIDFPGLQKNVLLLLENHKPALEDLTNHFKFILVDEYQDTNPIQEEFFELISQTHKNLCVVGDEDQSIYAFRGADPKNFMLFEDKYGAKRVTLDKNFRSTSNIVSVSDNFIKEYRHYEKTISPVRTVGNDVAVLKSLDVRDEAKNVVKLIKEMKEKNIMPHYGYVALLFRSVKYHAPAIINELKQNGIPYIVRGDGGFLKREEIRSMLYLLSFVDPPEYDRFNQWNKWWNISMFETEFLNLSEETLTSLNSLDDEFDLSSLLKRKEFIEHGIKNKEDIFKLMRLNNLKLDIVAKDKSILEIFYELLEISGYLEWLLMEGSEESEVKLFNLAKLSSIIHKYEYINKRPKIKDLMWYMYMLPRSFQYDEEIMDNPRSVKLLTVHQAKGLEFPVVFVCSVIKNRFPGRNRKTKEIVPLPEKLLLSHNEQSELEDRRLFYVAMTRAQDALVISTADKINTQRVGYSPYINEIFKCGEVAEDCGCINGECKPRELEENDPIYLSYSSIDTYKTCPFRYKMIYEYGFTYPPSYMQNYGVIVHNCLYKLHQSMKLGYDINEKQIKTIVSRCWIRLHHKQEKDDQLRESLEKKLMKYYKNVKPYFKKIISAEEPFSIVKEGSIVNGRTDLIIENPEGKLELIDFKARAQAGIEETSVEFQLKMYELALKDKYNFDKLCAYTFKDDEMHYITRNKKELEDINKELDDVCECILKEDFEPKKNSFCSLCLFKFCCSVG